MSEQSNTSSIPIPVGPVSENTEHHVIFIRPEVSYSDATAQGTLLAALPTSSATTPSSVNLRAANDSLNLASQETAPTPGKKSERDKKKKTQSAKPKKSTTATVFKKKTSPGGKTAHSSQNTQSPSQENSFRLIKCGLCGQPGHVKKRCKLSTRLGGGGTRQSRNAKLIEASLRETAARHVGALDCHDLAPREVQDAAPESVTPSCAVPEEPTPRHYSSISSSADTSQEEDSQLESILNRICTTPPSNWTVFCFWLKLFLIVLFFVDVPLVFVLGEWALIFIMTNMPLIFFFCWFAYCNLGLHKLYDRMNIAPGIKYRMIGRAKCHTDEEQQYKKDELRVDSHSLKKAELKPHLYFVEMMRVPDQSFIWRVLFPEEVLIRRVVISSTLLKQLISDVDFYYDPKQLVLRAQLQSSRNQRVYISSADLALYGDVYGETALLAGVHNDYLNRSKRRMLDFAQSPATL